MMDEITPTQEARWFAFFELRSEDKGKTMIEPSQVAAGLETMFSS